MTRKSSIAKLAAPVKSAIDAALKSNQLTLDELLCYLRDKYPTESLPGRSALGRYKQQFDERQRDLGDAAQSAETLARYLAREIERESTGDLKIKRIIVLEFEDVAPKVKEG